MSTGLQLVKGESQGATADDEQFVTFTVAGQVFGVPALRVRDVLRSQPLTRVPLARAEIVGAMNLRGHIIPAIGLRVRLDCSPSTSPETQMCIVVEGRGEPICLIVDSVGDVVTIKSADIDPNPGSLIPAWAHLSRGIYRSNNELVLILNVDQLINLE